ncbi:MAG: ATP-binding protein [Pyrinomonadaceae bacterium]|nr:ATP-binding protein [Pyrinomonadaceae bacterium]
MKIAVTGTHRTGKTTLAEDLCRTLPKYTLFDEPYHQLVEAGHLFSDPPSGEDFLVQLETSLEQIQNCRDDHVIFDRCPLDLFAYLRVTLDSIEVEFDKLTHKIAHAMQRIDLVVFVPVEEPKRIVLDNNGLDELRTKVASELNELVFEDPWNLECQIVSVSGPQQDRKNQVLRILNNSR